MYTPPCRMAHNTHPGPWNKILFVGAQKTLQGTIFYQWNNLGHRWRGGCSHRRKEWSNWQRVEADKRWRFALNHSIPMAQRNMLQDLPLRSLSSPCTRKLTRMLRIRRQLHHTLCGSSAWNGNNATRRHCCYNSMDHGEGTCLTSNIVARWSKIKYFMSWGRVSKYKYE